MFMLTPPESTLCLRTSCLNRKLHHQHLQIVQQLQTSGALRSDQSEKLIEIRGPVSCLFKRTTLGDTDKTCHDKNTHTHCMTHPLQVFHWNILLADVMRSKVDRGQSGENPVPLRPISVLVFLWIQTSPTCCLLICPSARRPLSVLSSVLSVSALYRSISNLPRRHVGTQTAMAAAAPCWRL